MYGLLCLPIFFRTLKIHSKKKDNVQQKYAAILLIVPLLFFDQDLII